MKINKSELLQAMTECIPGVEKGNIILEGVDTFVFDGNFLHSYNDNISVTVSLPDGVDLKGVVKSADFYKLVSKLKEEETEIITKDNKWELTNGKSKAKITLLENQISEYLETLNTEDVKWNKLPSEFSEALRLCSIANNYSPHAGLFIKGKEVVSTDMRRLNYYTLPSDMGEIYLSDPAVRELLKFSNLKKFSLNGEWIHFKTQTQTIFSCRCMDSETFPFKVIMDKKKDMKKGKEDLTNSLPSSLKETIDRVATFSRDLNGNLALSLKFKKKEIIVYSKRESGEITEAVSLDTPFEENVSLEIWVDIPFLKEALDKVPDFYIKKVKGEKDNGKEVELPVVIFTAENYTQIVATMIPND